MKDFFFKLKMNKPVAMAVNIYLHEQRQHILFIILVLLTFCDAGYDQIIMADMRAAFYLTSSFTHNQISALTQLTTWHPQHKRNRMCIYSHGLNTLGTVENTDLNNYSLVLKLDSSANYQTADVMGFTV